MWSTIINNYQQFANEEKVVNNYQQLPTIIFGVNHFQPLPTIFFAPVVAIAAVVIANTVSNRIEDN